MPNLITLLLTLSLSSAIAISLIDHTNHHSFVRLRLTNQIETGFKDLKDGYRSALEQLGQRPVDIAQITPSYAFIPPSPWSGAKWTYGVGSGTATSAYFCLYAPFNQNQFPVLSNLANRFSPQAFFVNEYCGAAENINPQELTQLQNGSFLAVTLWVNV